MSRFTKLTDRKGFTIIEVLIVLAIAGLILLIVFLAVPALQRNSRNTQIRNSAAAMLGGVNDFISNNNGQLPANNGCNLTGNTVDITGASGTTTAQAKVQAGYSVSCTTSSTNASAAGQIVVNLGFKCNGNSIGSATARAYAASFMIEANGGSPALQCVES